MGPKALMTSGTKTVNQLSSQMGCYGRLRLSGAIYLIQKRLSQGVLQTSQKMDITTY